MARLSPQAYRRVTFIALVLLVVIIVSGGAVRLTGSGLGCPKWPQCTATHLVAPGRFHPSVEFWNRVFTALVSLAVIAAALGAWARVPRRRDLCVLGGGLVVGLIGQIVLGGLTVRHRLEPGFVMAHFLLSMVLVWDAVVLHHRAGGQAGRAAGGLAWAGRAVAALVGLTVVLGTVVTGAGPHSGANSADGRVAARWHLDLHRVAQVHGTSAMLLLAVVLTVLWKVRVAGMTTAERRGEQLVSALGLQIAIGYTQYFMGIPVLLVAFHILGAALVWVTALRFALELGAPAAVDAHRAVAAV